MKAQDAELQALTEQVAELKAALADAQRAAALEDTRTEREKRLAADLYAHPELIPIEGTLGGTMRFFPDESAVRVLSTASYMPLVYAYAEDGHPAVNLCSALKTRRTARRMALRRLRPWRRAYAVGAAGRINRQGSFICIFWESNPAVTIPAPPS
ncbi:MAG: hypothetical protein ACLRZH_04425 [Ruthenibacterium lactatiformans]